MSVALVTPYEPPRLEWQRRDVARIGVMLLLSAFILSLLAYALVTYGLAFFIVGWYAWLAIGAFALLQLILYLQRNRFGVGADWIAPTYRPLSRVLGGRYVLRRDEIASLRLLGVADSDPKAYAGSAPYVQIVILMKSGRVLRFPSHSSHRSIRRQVRSETEVGKALKAIEDFARAHGLLEGATRP